MPSKNTRNTTRSRPVRRRRRSNNGLVRLAIFGLFAVAAVIFITNYSQDLIAGLNAGTNEEVPRPLAAGDTWWDASYPYRRLIETGTSRDALLTVTVDHAGLVGAGKSSSDGHDLKLIAQIDDAFAEISQSNQFVNSASTSITFDTSRYPDAHYYLYYGNLAARPSQVLGAVVITRTGSQVNLQAEQMPQCGIRSTRVWNLTEQGRTAVPLNIISGIDAAKTKVSYAFVGDAELKMSDFQIAELVKDAAGNPVLNLSNVEPGDLKIALIAETDGNKVRCNDLSIRVSKPIYVAWTIDWEGYDVQQWVLDSVQELASKYKIPMTHFFNPRIYVASDISENRRQTLTNWVLARASAFGDEIAMHMHMHFDMISATGLEPKHTPNWGTGRDGYDVLTSAYNYSEMTKILTWGIQQFSARGLPKPTGFRAGGWFAGAETLRALNDYGFVYDSSGREAYSFGAQSKQGIWNLQFTTQPYQPSQNDPNVPGTPSLNLWEVPDNGGDSYWFSYEDMMGRLYANYQPGTIAEETKLVTYLTHFDWYDTDKPKLESLFAELNRSSYQEDKGPIVFTTISTALDAWK